MHLTHLHPLGGHLGACNTLAKRRDCFHWPGMKPVVKNFYQRCPQCQHTTLTKPAPALLIPLLVIEVSFERVKVDLVGVFLKSG